MKDFGGSLISYTRELIMRIMIDIDVISVFCVYYMSAVVNVVFLVVMFFVFGIKLNFILKRKLC